MKKYVRLEDVCSSASSNIAQKDLSDLKGDYPIYGASGLIKNVDFYKQDKEYIAVVKDGAGIGRTYLLPAKSSVIGTMQYILPYDNIDISYLYYAITFMRLEKYFSGATIPHIYFKNYKREKLPLPNIENQRKISCILYRIDTLLELRKQQLNKLDELVKSRFIEMFGEPFYNTKKWDVELYKDICELITDGEHITPKRTTIGIYLLSARNILNHKLNLDDVDYIDVNEYNRISKRVQPMENDILISCSGSIGRVCLVPSQMKFQMVRSVALLRLKKCMNPVFMEYLISMPYTQKQINRSKTASSQANLFQGKIKKLKAIVPTINLQNDFAYFVKQVDKSKIEIQRSLDKLETLKKSLMQEYFA